MRLRRHNRPTVVIRRARDRGLRPRCVRLPIARDCRPIGKFPMIAGLACDMLCIVLAREPIIPVYHNVKGTWNNSTENRFNGIAIGFNTLFSSAHLARS